MKIHNYFNEVKNTVINKQSFKQQTKVNLSLA